MNDMIGKQTEDPRLAEILDVIFRFATGDLQARGTLKNDDSALDGVVAGINILGEELEAKLADNKRAQLALAESEALLRNVFDSVQDGIILAEATSGRFKLVNTAICRMLGYTRDELLNLGVPAIHPEAECTRILHVFNSMARGETRLAAHIPMLRKDGTIFHADITSAPLIVSDEACLVGVFRDASERDRAEQAEELARRDGLTGLYNHITFFRILEDEIARVLRYGGGASLMMIDIDHFKRVNDSFGHLAGDAILRDLSALLRKESRTIDSVCRYGGEEITVILPSTDTAEANLLAERLRKAVERHVFDVGEGLSTGITASIGIATCPRHARAAEALVKAADLALYAAKQGGRNRCCVWSPALVQDRPKS